MRNLYRKMTQLIRQRQTFKKSYPQSMRPPSVWKRKSHAELNCHRRLFWSIIFSSRFHESTDLKHFLVILFNKCFTAINFKRENFLVEIVIFVSRMKYKNVQTNFLRVKKIFLTSLKISSKKKRKKKKKTTIISLNLAFIVKMGQKIIALYFFQSTRCFLI